MKLHDNSRLGGGLVIVLSYANLLKIQRFIERDRSRVGGADFQENIPAESCYYPIQKCPRDTLSAELRCHGDVEQLALIGSELTIDSKSRDGISDNRDQEVVIQVIPDIPVRRLGAGGLDCGDRG